MNVWWIFLLVCGAGMVVYQLMPAGVPQDLIYLCFGLASATAVVVGVRIHHPVVRSAWYLMAAGLMLWSIADAIFSWIADVQHVHRFPTAADAVYLAAYPFVAAGLFVLIRLRRSLTDVAGFLDSAILTVGLALLSWVLLAGPTIQNYQESWWAAAVGVAYPIADVVLLGLLVGLVTTPGGRTASLRLLVMAVVVLIVVDLAASALDLFTVASTDAINFLWLTSYALWGGAALHPSMRSLSERTTEVSVDFTHGRLAALTVAVLVAPGILVIQRLVGVRNDEWAVAIGSVTMSLLVVARMKVAIDQIAAANRLRMQAQQALAFQAAHDTLTGLPNRAHAVELIGRALNRAVRNGTTVALLFIDLDGFKRVNDTLGHAAGDDVLRAVAGRLRANVRAGDAACRLGGDEFVVLLEVATDTLDALGIAERLVQVLSTPILVAGQQKVTIGASVGVAFSHDRGTDPDDLVREADAALYRAKRSGRGRVEVFDAEMRRDLQARTALESDLAAAINDDHLVLHYQPIVHLASGAVQGYEALVRWCRAGVLLPPSEFVPIVEQSELICEMGAWVLQQATRQIARWNAGSSTPSVPVAVNVSGRHISRPRVLDDVRRAVASADINPAQLILEITETALTDSSAAVKHLEELRRDGIAVSIDDFGTGYSSIARLEHLPIDVLKVDRRFLDQSTRSAEQLLRLIVQTGHALGLGVIAEGVETEEQAILLQSLGCESAQGYHLARPCDPATIARLERSDVPPLVPASSSRSPGAESC